MRLLDFLYPSLCAATLLPSLAEARKAPNAVLLSSVQSLTLRQGQKTSHRRVSAIPQVSELSIRTPGAPAGDNDDCKGLTL